MIFVGDSQQRQRQDQPSTCSRLLDLTIKNHGVPPPYDSGLVQIVRTRNRLDPAMILLDPLITGTDSSPGAFIIRASIHNVECAIGSQLHVDRFLGRATATGVAFRKIDKIVSVIFA